jgi:tetratricopeptide (TPR) repeat protein
MGSTTSQNTVPTEHLRTWLRAVEPVVFPCALLLAGVAVYANSLSGAFVFDDMTHIVDNPAIRQCWPLGPLIRSCPSRPLLPISLALNYAWGGLDVTGYHLFNVVVHLATGLTLYGLVRRTLRLPPVGPRWASSADGVAFVTALLWIVHPLQTQAVTYVVQRCEAMMALFFLLTMYGYLRGATSARSWPWYGMALVTFCLGLGSKEVMVTVVPVLLLYDRCFLADSWREVVQRRGWVQAAFCLPLIAAATMLVPALQGGAESTAGFQIQAATPWEYARSQPGVILHYLRLCVWPYPQCLDYGWPVETRWLIGIGLPALLVFGLFVLSAWDLFRGGRRGFLGMAFFLVLAPTSSIMPIQDLCVEHRMYLPLACVVAAGVLGGYQLLRRLPAGWDRRCAVTMVLGAVVALGGLTVLRNQVYASVVGMWTDVVQVTRYYGTGSHQDRTLNNLGDALLDAGRIQQGLDVLRQAEQLQPSSAEIHGNLGRGLLQLGQVEAARPHCEAAVRLSPDVARFRQQLGVLAAQQRRHEDAEREFREALRLAPLDVLIETNLGQCLAAQGRTAEAIECWQQVLERDPQFTDARRRLATTLAEAGRGQEAAGQAHELLRCAPRDVQVRLLCGMIETQRGHDPAALEHFRQALQLDPRLAAAHLQAGNSYRRLGQLSEAIRSYEEAVSLDENLAEAHNNLAGLLAEKEPDQAVRHFRQAVDARPDFLEARFNLAATLARLGFATAAAEEYRAVLKLRPDFAPARDNLQALHSTKESPR